MKWLLLTLPYLFSCKHTSTQASRPSHDEERFSNSYDPSQWVELSDNEYESMFEPKDILVPVDNPMTIRLQAWMDAMRDEILKSQPGLAASPRPRIRILKIDEPNAFVSSVTVCVDAPLFVDIQAATTSEYLGA